MADNVELSELVGIHMLDGVDTYSENIKREWSECDEDCQIIKFRLDGIIYLATEDPSDGYRSSMDSLRITDGNLMNTFTPIQVMVKMKEKGEWHDNDALEFIDTKSGLIVMEVGTDNSDGYYPSFVGVFTPENMSINIPKATNE